MIYPIIFRWPDRSLVSPRSLQCPTRPTSVMPQVEWEDPLKTLQIRLLHTFEKLPVKARPALVTIPLRFKI